MCVLWHMNTIRLHNKKIQLKKPHLPSCQKTCHLFWPAGEQEAPTQGAEDQNMGRPVPSQSELPSLQHKGHDPKGTDIHQSLSLHFWPAWDACATEMTVSCSGRLVREGDETATGAKPTFEITTFHTLLSKLKIRLFFHLHFPLGSSLGVSAYPPSLQTEPIAVARKYLHFVNVWQQP